MHLKTYDLGRSKMIMFEYSVISVVLVCPAGVVGVLCRAGGGGADTAPAGRQPGPAPVQQHRNTAGLSLGILIKCFISH